MGIFTEDTTTIEWWQGCFCLAFFKFFFGYGHGNFFGILVNRNDIALISEMKPLVRKVGTKETVEINTGAISKYKEVLTMVATAYFLQLRSTI